MGRPGLSGLPLFFFHVHNFCYLSPMRGMLLVLLSMATALAARADILNLSNGDRFTGHIELVDAKEVHVKTESIGLVKIPREKVASIFFGTNAPGAGALASKDPNAAGPKFDDKMIEKVQQDFLATAGPEAN